MTNTPSPHYTDDERKRVLAFVVANPGKDGLALTNTKGHPRNIGRMLHQFDNEGLVEYVPVDGSHSSGLGLGSPAPHQWQLTDAGRAFLIAEGLPS